MASFTYTTDGLSNVATQTDYATPAGGSTVIPRTTKYTYNSYGQVLQVQYPDTTLADGTTQSNVSRTFAYAGPNLQLSRMTDEEGHETLYSQWDSVTGLPGRITQEGGDQGVLFAYDALGNLVQQLDPQGAAVNDAPLPTTYALDGLYRVKTVADSAGQITTYSYDIESHVTSVAPPAGAAVTTTYDLRGFISGGTTPDGAWSRFVDANGSERRNRNYRGFESNMTLDFMGRITESRVPGASTVTDGSGGGGPAIEKMDFVYDQKDATGYFTQLRQPGSTANRVTKTYFDERRRVKQVNDPDQATQHQHFYDELDHRIASQTLLNGVLQSCTVQQLDARDRVLKVTTQDGPYGGTSQHQNTVSTFYNRTGHVVAVVDPLGNPNAGGYAHKTTYVRDARGRVSAIIDGKGNIVRQNVYGDDNRITQVWAPDPSTKSTTLVPLKNIAYTSRKELKSAFDGQGNGMTFTYNALPNQLNTATDALGRVAQTLYDSNTQRPSTEIKALGTPDESRVLKTWSSGLLTQTSVWNPATQAYNAAYSYSYDQANRMEKYSPPSVAQTTQVAPEQYFFNEFGEPNKEVAGSKTVAHTYNSLGQVTSSAWSGAYNAVISRTYNGLGFQTSISDGTHQRTMDYVLWQGVPQNETFSVGGSNWKVQTHGYDLAGNYTGLTDAEAKPHAWPVDENNRPTDSQYNSLGVKSITYTPGGLVDTETTKDASGNPIAVTTHQYDSQGRRTTSRTVKSATGEVLTEYGWDYDPAYQVTGVHLRHLAADYTLLNDNLGRVGSESTPGNANGTQAPAFTNPPFGPLPTGNESAPTADAQGTPHVLLSIAAHSASYTYQAAGNRATATIDGVTVTYTYNAANQLISESSAAKTVTHQYDQWGNESQRTTTQGTVTTTETYTYNHLNQLSGYTNSATGANWQYSFWPDGDRYEKTNLAAGTSELYIPRFGDVATEYTQTGSGTPALENTYIQGIGVDMKNTRITSASVRRHYLTNQVGTLGMSVDDMGSPVDTSVRDAWGVQQAGSTSERFGAIAQRETDTESGLVYMRHRMYDPALGRFTQTDPVRSLRPFSHYAYCGNSPLNRTDPTGEYWKIPQGPGTDEMVRDLEKYTGRQITVDASGNAWFGQSSADQFASSGDMEWIWSGQNDTAENDFSGLWRHLTGGDQWHRERFSKAFLANSKMQTSFQGFMSGAQGGSSIVANTMTFGATDKLNITDSEQYQGPEYTASRVLAVGARELLITAATGGVGNIAKGTGTVATIAKGVQAAILVNEAGTGGWQIGTGVNKIADGDASGWLDVAAGGLRVAGAVGNAGNLTGSARNPVYDNRTWGAVRAERNAGLLTSKGTDMTWEHFFTMQKSVSGGGALQGFSNSYLNSGLRISRSLNSSLGAGSTAARTMFRTGVIGGGVAAGATGYWLGSKLDDAIQGQ